MIVLICIVSYIVSMFICLIPSYREWRKSKWRNGDRVKDWWKSIDFDNIGLAFVPVLNAVAAIMLTLYGLWWPMFNKVLGNIKIVPSKKKKI